MSVVFYLTMLSIYGPTNQKQLTIPVLSGVFIDCIDPVDGDCKPLWNVRQLFTNLHGVICQKTLILR